MPIIEVNHVTKEYQLGQLQSLKTNALNQWRRLTGQPVEERAPFKMPDNINFSIEPSEVIGIIGHNCTGKSTMLKLQANNSKPSSGNIELKGKVRLVARTIRQGWWRMLQWHSRRLIGIRPMSNMRRSCAPHSNGKKTGGWWIQ